jgi:hypothetical protein
VALYPLEALKKSYYDNPLPSRGRGCWWTLRIGLGCKQKREIHGCEWRTKMTAEGKSGGFENYAMLDG